MATLEAANLLRNARLATQRSWLLSALTVVKDFVVDVVEDVTIEEATGELLQTLAECTSTPSLEL
jgi:hypothetical protein